MKNSYGTKQEKCEKQILALKRTIIRLNPKIHDLEAIVCNIQADPLTKDPFKTYIKEDLKYTLGALIDYLAPNISPTYTDPHTELERKIISEFQDIRDENIDQMQNRVLDKARVSSLKCKKRIKKAFKKLKRAYLNQYYLKGNNYV